MVTSSALKPPETSTRFRCFDGSPAICRGVETAPVVARVWVGVGGHSVRDYNMDRNGSNQVVSVNRWYQSYNSMGSGGSWT